MRTPARIFRGLSTAAFLIFVFTTVIPVSARGVTGRQEALYQASDILSPYQNAGYRLSCDSSGKLIVNISAMPVRYGVPYPYEIPAPEIHDDLATEFEVPPHRLPPSLKRRLAHIHGYWNAVSTVLTWVSDQFTYSDHGLGAYSGDCNDAARTTVQLLRLAGIPAREAVGVIMDRDTKTLAGTSLHRFVEIYYPDLGWLFSDPLSSHHFVPASYIRLDDQHLDALLGLSITRRKPLLPLQPVGILDENPIPSRINLLRFF